MKIESQRSTREYKTYPGRYFWKCKLIQWKYKIKENVNIELKYWKKVKKNYKDGNSWMKFEKQNLPMKREKNQISQIQKEN